MMVRVTVAEEGGSVAKYRLFIDKLPMSYRQFIQALVCDSAFRQQFIGWLADASFEAYRIETPALSSSSIDRPFEFVLIDAPKLLNRNIDSVTFAEYFRDDYAGANSTQPSTTQPSTTQPSTTQPSTNQASTTQPSTNQASITKLGANLGIAEFISLGGDATMIAPLPRANHEIYNHLASFIRGAPVEQIDALWQVVGEVLERKVGDIPLWMNTEGSGVAWLHVRVDTRPKYYGYAGYKQLAPVLW